MDRSCEPGKVDLVIAGHYHRFLHLKPGEEGNNFPILIVGQDQVAHVDATTEELKVTVTTKTGTVVDSFTLQRHSSIDVSTQFRNSNNPMSRAGENLNLRPSGPESYEQEELYAANQVQDAVYLKGEKGIKLQ